jgi:hypothetical protein
MKKDSRIAGKRIGQKFMPEGLKALRASEQMSGSFDLHFEELPYLENSQ